MAVAKKVCVLCGGEKTSKLFYKHKEGFLNEKFGFCKECVNGIIDGDADGTTGLTNVLRMMDIPYVQKTWESAVDQDPREPFSKYLRVVALVKKYEGFADSELAANSKPFDFDGANDFTITEEMVSRWGVDKDADDYRYSEIMFEQLKAIKKPSTKLEEQRYCDAVKMAARLDRVLESGDVKEIAQLSKAYDGLITTLGLNIEMKSEDDQRSLGMKIRDWEQREPVPEMAKEFEDVDGIKKYIEKFLLFPFKRSLGLASEEEINKIYE